MRTRIGQIGTSVAILSVLCMPAVEALAASVVSLTHGDDVVDVIAGDNPVLEIKASDDAVGRVDVRVARYDRDSHGLLKAVFDESCEGDWMYRLSRRGVAAGSSVSLMLDASVPVGSYVLATRPAGSNGAFEPSSEPFSIYAQPLARAVMCDTGGAITLSLDDAPLMKRVQGRVVDATVRVAGANGGGQGVVVNPWGHVVTAASVVSPGEQVWVTFGPGALAGRAGETRARYQLLSDAVDSGALNAVFPEGKPVAQQVAVLVPVSPAEVLARGVGFVEIADRVRAADASPVLKFRTGLLGVDRESRRTRRVVPDIPVDDGVRFGADGFADAPLTFGADLVGRDIGGPLFDARGRVWAFQTADGTGMWAADLAARYAAWQEAGVLRRLTSTEE